MNRDKLVLVDRTDRDDEVIRKSVRNILVAIGEDPDRPGLKETPDRVTKMYREVFEGIQYSNQQIASMFNKCFDEPTARDLVLMKEIPAFSYCEHHIALMYNMKISVAYIPDQRVIGLSKIARIVDMVCKRLQLQERIGTDIAEIMSIILDTHDVMVVIEGEHSCMTTRGIKKPGTVTHSAVLRGLFKESPSLRAEVYSLLGK